MTATGAEADRPPLVTATSGASDGKRGGNRPTASGVRFRSFERPEVGGLQTSSKDYAKATHVSRRDLNTSMAFDNSLAVERANHGRGPRSIGSAPENRELQANEVVAEIRRP